MELHDLIHELQERAPVCFVKCFADIDLDNDERSLRPICRVDGCFEDV